MVDARLFWAIVTASGLKPGLWVKRMLDYYASKGIESGPVFRRWDRAGDAKASDYEYEFLTRLEAIQREEIGVIPATDNVFEDYGISRSLRRGSNSQATNQGVSSDDVIRMCRWSQTEKAQGRSLSLPMHHHYSEVRLMVPTLIRYSKAL